MTYTYKLSDGNFYEIANRKMLSELNAMSLRKRGVFYLNSVGLAIRVLHVSYRKKECILTHATNIMEGDLL